MSSLSPLKKKQIEAFHDKELTVKEISRKTHCTYAEIRNYLKSLGKDPIEAEKKADKEKEPASAATDTSSKANNVPTEPDEKQQSHSVSIEHYNTPLEKSQAALRHTKKELLAIYENLTEGQMHAWDLGELFHEVCGALEEEEE